MAERIVFVRSANGQETEAQAVENVLRTAEWHIRQAADLLRYAPVIRRNAAGHGETISPVAQDATDAATLDALGESIAARFTP